MPENLAGSPVLERVGHDDFRHLHTVYELLSVLEQDTPETRTLRPLVTVDGQFPTRRANDLLIPDTSLAACVEHVADRR